MITFRLSFNLCRVVLSNELCRIYNQGVYGLLHDYDDNVNTSS